MTSENNLHIDISTQPTWDTVKDVQTKTEKFVLNKGLSQDVSIAIVMCASELMENAVKYGTENPDGSDIRFDLNINDDNTVSIEVENAYSNDSDVENVIDNIEKIQESEDPSMLYVERLIELLDNVNPEDGHLGLLRIAYEGEFDLKYYNENGMLTVTAYRSIH